MTSAARGAPSGKPVQLELIDRRRFWSKVDQSGECWIWTGATGSKGYGSLGTNRGGVHHSFLAHRVAYELEVGPIPEGYVLDHLCRTRRCVRPAHLEPVPHLENLRRGVRILRTHCVAGHPYTADSALIIQINGNPTRACRICNSERQRQRRARLRGEP